MFARFEAHFRRDAALSCPEGGGPLRRIGESQLKELFLRAGGVSFDDGLYRVMTTGIIDSAQAFIADAFPDFASRVEAFAFDWLGRIFALDPGRLEGGLPAVVMFEPGTGQALEIPCNLTTFHENELITYGEEALAAGFYKQWLAKRGAAPKHDQCVGYKKPLFLGGQDVVDNLELTDLDVYWTVSGQLVRKMRGVPPGTRVTKVGLID